MKDVEYDPYEVYSNIENMFKATTFKHGEACCVAYEDKKTHEQYYFFCALDHDVYCLTSELFYKLEKIRNVIKKKNKNKLKFFLRDLSMDGCKTIKQFNIYNTQDIILNLRKDKLSKI